MEYPLVNGHRHSFASVELSLDGKRFVAFREINYSARREIAEVRGAHPEPLGFTRGDISNEGNFVLYSEESEEFLRALGDGYFDKTFNITVSYAEEGQPVITDEILGCRLVRVERAHSRGTDPLDVRFEFRAARIKFGGRAPVRNPLQGVA